MSAGAVQRLGPNDPEQLLAAVRSKSNVELTEGDHVLREKLQVVFPITLTGSSRNNTILHLGVDTDYLLEIGDGHPGPNAGTIQRLRFYGRDGSQGCLHLNNLSHMWLLNELIFSGGHCPALIADNCWDSNYTNIDIFSHFKPGAEAGTAASVILRNGTANIYFRGLRIEGALSGGLYIEDAPIYVLTGKIDNGFGGPQSAAAITIGADGCLLLDDFYIGGIREQFAVELQGSLRLGRVSLDGGTGAPAAINDRRAWRHQDPLHFPHASSASIGPTLAMLDLGDAEFHRFHPSVESETPAAVFSRIHPLRQVRNLVTVANGSPSNNSLLVGTNVVTTHNHQFKNSFLVHNSTGTEAAESPGARRRILDSFVGGNLLLQGEHPVQLDGDWSIEYCAGHYTPIRCNNVVLGSVPSLFAVLARGARIGSAPRYIGDNQNPAYGTTRFHLMSSVPHGQDLRGLFLLDERSGEPFYLDYGLDQGGAVGVMYDRRSLLSADRTFSVIAGYDAAIRVDGTAALWTHAGVQHRMLLTELARRGFGPEQLPLWGFGAASQHAGLSRPVTADEVVTIDLATGHEFEISAQDGRALAFSDPVNHEGIPGRRITLTLRNVTKATLAPTQWSAAYKLAVWSDPAAGTSRSITFRYDGHSWIEVGRTPADVPN
ncbi:MAG: hypothetical protein JOY91_05830 [Sinobacteraceae bacterium]|nr:hypothetical protein [Nevskiaceae bacterium]